MGATAHLARSALCPGAPRSVDQLPRDDPCGKAEENPWALGAACTPPQDRRDPQAGQDQDPHCAKSNGVPPPVHDPRTSACDLMCKEVSAEVRVKMRSQWSRVGPNPMTGVPVRKGGSRVSGGWRGSATVQGCPGLPEPGRGRMDPPLTPPEKPRPRTPCFWNSGLQKRESVNLLFRLPGVRCFGTAAPGHRPRPHELLSH